MDHVRSICWECPFVIECRVWSIITFLQHGIAGGLTQSERVQIRQKLRKAKFPFHEFKPKLPPEEDDE